MKKGRSDPLSLGRLYQCVETLQAWGKWERQFLNESTPEWGSKPILGLPEWEQRIIQNIGLILAVKVSLLKVLEMGRLNAKLLKDAKKKKW